MRHLAKAGVARFIRTRGFALLLFMLVCAIGLAAQTPGAPAPASGTETKTEGNCSVSGRVIVEATGAPLPGASVSLATRGQTLGAKTDAQGRFRIDTIPSGRYTLVAFAAGYEAAPVFISLAAGEQLTGIVLKVRRSAVVAGKVEDGDRRPVEGAKVWLLREGGIPLARASVTGHATTNHAGQYRILNVMPGTYKVAAEVLTAQVRSGGPGASLPEPVEQAVTTFYPNAASLDGGAAVAVGAGQTVEAVNIVLAVERTFCVHSEVQDALAGPETPIEVRVEDERHLGRSALARTQVPNGSEFMVCGLPTGDYTLAAWTPKAERCSYQYFTVTNRSSKVPGLQVRPLGQLRGSLKIARETGNEDAMPSALSLSFTRRGGCSEGSLGAASLAQEGPFVLDNACPVKTLLRARPPQGYYVKSARAGSTDALREPFIPGLGELAIELGQDGGTVTARVSDKEGRPVSGAVALLWPDPSPAKLTSADVVGAPSDSAGQAVFPTVAPGAYRVLAVIQESPFSQRTSPEFLQAHASRAERVDVPSRGKVNVQVTVFEDGK